MLAAARTFTLLGIEAHEVRVEVDVRQGLPTFTLVGLPDAAVRESRDRVRAALSNSGFDFPQLRITANLAPADLRKAGPGFDLAIAAGLLAATSQLDGGSLADLALAGELALDGTIRPVPGILAMAESARRAGIRAIVVPAACAAEAALIAPGHVIPVERLDQLRAIGGEEEPRSPLPVASNGLPPLPDLRDLRGQGGLRRALEVGAAGGHSLLATGPPGAGKSMGARRLPSILPPLEDADIVEAARVASACGRPVELAVAGRRSFRAPHHTISTAGLIGGGNPPRPGEVTLAHRGVLFLDELPEFNRGALEALRQPLEDGTVRIVRARYSIELPCRFQLIAAANPCPCGRGERSGDCTCDPASVRSYAAKLTGALCDRIDISIAVEQPDLAAFGEPGESSAAVRDRVLAARERQRARRSDGRPNAELAMTEIELTGVVERLLAEAGLTAGLSGRGRERAIRLARTIADLDDRDEIGVDHLDEALSMRRRSVR